MESIGGKRYFISFIDHFSHHTRTFAIRYKNEAFEKFKEYKAWAENQTGRTIRKFRTDGGLEYCCSEFESFLRKHGIVHQKTAPHTTQQNGVAERFNRTIGEKMQCMMSDAGLSRHFWAEAMSTAVYIINRIPCRSSGTKTPEELWTNVRPDLSTLRVFGCDAMVHVPKVNRRKLDDKSIAYTFLGYHEGSKAYRLYNKATKKIIVSRDVVFIENKPSGDQVIAEKENNNMFVCYIPIESTDRANAACVAVDAVVVAAENIHGDETLNDSDVDVSNLTCDINTTFFYANSTFQNTVDAESSSEDTEEKEEESVRCLLLSSCMIQKRIKKQ